MSAERIFSGPAKAAFFVLLEVLREASYRRAHLPGAIRFQDTNRAPELLPDKSAEIVAYCSDFN